LSKKRISSADSSSAHTRKNSRPNHQRTLCDVQASAAGQKEPDEERLSPGVVTNTSVITCVGKREGRSFGPKGDDWASRGNRSHRYQEVERQQGVAKRIDFNEGAKSRVRHTGVTISGERANAGFLSQGKSL